MKRYLMLALFGLVTFGTFATMPGCRAEVDTANDDAEVKIDKDKGKVKVDLD